MGWLPTHCMSNPLCVPSIVYSLHRESTPSCIHYIAFHSIICPLNRVFNQSFVHLIRACIVVRDTPYDAANFRNDKTPIASSCSSIASFNSNFLHILWVVLCKESSLTYLNAWTFSNCISNQSKYCMIGHLGTEVSRGRMRLHPGTDVSKGKMIHLSSWHGVIKRQDDTSIILARGYQRVRWYIGHLGTEVSKDKVASVILVRMYPGTRWDIGHIGTGASGRRDSNHLSKGTRRQSSRHGCIRTEKRPRQNRRTSGKVEAINASDSPSLQFSHHRYSPVSFLITDFPSAFEHHISLHSSIFFSSPTILLE